jgi:hypothetical protein
MALDLVNLSNSVKEHLTPNASQDIFVGGGLAHQGLMVVRDDRCTVSDNFNGVIRGGVGGYKI